jgi:hypothetical protein
MLAACLLPGAVGCSSDLRIRLDDQVQRPARSALIFFVDGMDVQRMDELLAAGRLPNIRSRFVEQGVRVRHAITSFPSSTYPNCASTITGRFPGHHDILANFWFDRRTLTSRDYMTYSTYLTINDHLRLPTVYDLLSHELTASIGHHTYRGASIPIPGCKLFFWAWALGRYELADFGVESGLIELAEAANRARRWPVLIMTYYPGVDEIGHRHGTNSDRYAIALDDIDQIIGHVTAALDAAGLGGSTTYVLMADHGMVPGSEEGESKILRWLRRYRGMRMRQEPIDDVLDYQKRLAIMAGYDSFGAIDAGRVAMIHLRGSRGWESCPEPGEVLDWLNQEPQVARLAAVQMTLLRAGRDRVRAVSREGSAVIERSEAGGALRYRIAESEGDPLGYQRDAKLTEFVKAGWHTSREWLTATASARFPDFVPQAVELFDSPRSGDVVFMAAEGYLFSERGEHGGHGSCLARDMRIPLFFAGPDLPKGAEIDHARLVDIMPTILGLLGHTDRLKKAAPIDGIDLTPELRSASAR